jgi:hypothetical protein
MDFCRYMELQRRHKYDSCLQFRCTCNGDSSVPDLQYVLLQKFRYIVWFQQNYKRLLDTKHAHCKNRLLKTQMWKIKHSKNNLACGIKGESSAVKHPTEGHITYYSECHMIAEIRCPFLHVFECYQPSSTWKFHSFKKSGHELSC